MTRLTLQFEINWKLTLFTVLLFPLLCRLGFWQLSRAEEKRSLLATQQAQQALPPIDYSPQTLPADFRLVKAEGEFDTERYWLIEGRQQQGRLGYEVVMPLRVAEGLLLVNRGWVPAGRYREDNPLVTSPAGKVQVTGSLVTPSDSPLIEHEFAEVTQWPQRILEIDVDLLSQQYGAELPGKVLRISAQDNAAFAVAWRTINMSPQKHTAYAVQWFSMAGVLAVLWLFASSNLRQLLFSNTPR